MMVNHECRHIKTNGCKCESHALRGMPYCHFHDKVHRQRFARTGPAAPPLRLVFPEDRAGILLALDQVFAGLCTQAITARQATVLISGLRLASKNVEQGIFLSPSSAVETVSVTDAGHELGPEARPCTTCEDCSICPDRHLALGGKYEDFVAMARAIIAKAPDRVIWGSDWPHSYVFEANQMPNDGDLIDMLADFAPDEAVRNRILVDNPKRLFDF